jgi:hypothetical protein
MEIAFAYLILYGPPTLLAATPGIVAIVVRRPRLGCLQILGALIVTFPLSIYLDRLETAELTARGYIADSLFFIFRPWVHAIFYGLFSVVLSAIASGFLPEKPKNKCNETNHPSVRLASWLEEMRREREQTTSRGTRSENPESRG